MAPASLVSIRRHVCAVVLAFAAWAVGSTARAGNDDSILVGSRASMTGGVVQALVGDGSAAYHNPAGLANVVGQHVDISASVNGFRYSHVGSLLVTPDGSSTAGSVLDWVLVPSAAAYVRELAEDVVVAFGVFVPEGSDQALRLTFESDAGTRWFYTVQQTLDEYQYTPAVAYRISPSLRIGLSLAGIYRADYSALQVAAETSGSGSAIYSKITSQADYGLNGSLGVQWDVSPTVHLGATLVSPTLGAITDYAATGVRNVAAAGDGADSFESEGADELIGNWDIVLPAELRAGFGIDFGDLHVGLDGDINTSLEREQLRLRRRWLGNVRVGGLYQLGPNTSVGAGLFTDLGAQSGTKRHYAGIACGIRLVTEYELKDGSPIRFGSVFGVRYAYGWGDVEGVRVELVDNALSVVPIGSPVSAHELALNVGSELSF